MSKRRLKKRDVLGIAVSLFAVAFLLLIAFFVVKNINGNTTITNSAGEINESQSISCESDKVKYPLLEKQTGEKFKTKIDAVFNDNKLTNVSLTYKMNFDDQEMIDKKETEIRIVMNRSFADDNLSADTFNSNYAKLNDAVQYSMNATKKELSSTTAKYFMLENAAGKYSQDSLTKVYSELGLKCIVKK